MDDGARKHLHDILEACRLIELFTKGKALSDYRDDPMLRSAVERQFQIIGEALQQMMREYPSTAISITDHRSIVNFRHILVHGYDRIDDEVVWGVIERSLPLLHREVEELLRVN
jgi:uncharacterized protein with HEPN domain